MNEEEIKSGYEKIIKGFEKINKNLEMALNEHEQFVLVENAEKYRLELLSILKNSLKPEQKFDINELKDKSDFLIEEPKYPELIKISEKPKVIEEKLKFTIIENLIRPLRSLKVKKIQNETDRKILDWRRQSDFAEKSNINSIKNYEEGIEKWRKERKIFIENQTEYNDLIDQYKLDYEEKSTKGIEKYCFLLIQNSLYPENLLNEFELSYNNKVLVIDYLLPLKDIIPPLKSVKYIKSRDVFNETHMKDKEVDEIYESIIYQLSLKVTYDLYMGDNIDTIESIVFNGWVKDINKSTGKMETKCVLSLQTKKNAFFDLELENVDPKLCFKKLKGICGGNLSELIPVAPILDMNREDRRFIESKSIEKKISGQNIAELGWEEFEHLVRELFEKEFSNNGSEVRVTQSSRDGGVDAIMFDPDPIRGGKFVIQAKRYTNVVGVSAVRDLYGTVMNEGASKGILVTTSSFGADSYEFAKDKPLTLINGNNLLHLLNKHGYNARLDIVEARKNLGL